MFNIEEFKSSRRVITPSELVDAFENVSKRLHNQWENAPDLETRENCFQGIKALQGLLNEIIKETGD